MQWYVVGHICYHLYVFMKILGIETSCDETACGIVEDGSKLLSNVVLSSIDLHKTYGGVVPEIAARSHIEAIIPVIEQSLEQAKCSWDDIDGIAVTYGAGLGGSLLVGVMTARTLAIAKNKPLYAINHVEAHIYANFLTATGAVSSTSNHSSTANDTAPAAVQEWRIGDDSYKLRAQQPEFPMLGLIVSGGHTQLVLWRDHFDYTLLGQTRDDAVGEAFDKVAKIIGLPYPGGPSISSAAETGDAETYQLPKARLDSAYEFSFSGLKTAVLRLAQKEIGHSHDFPSHKVAENLSESQRANIAASFQRIAAETLVDATLQAYDEHQPKSVVIGGGVAANQELRRQLAERLPLPIEYQDIRLMTDNGAMVATLGCYHAMRGQPIANPETLSIEPNLSM
jgi:N6-L-threonylcarbamoyladenine synthase